MASSNTWDYHISCLINSPIKGLVTHNGNVHKKKSMVIEKTHESLHKSSCSLMCLRFP